MLLIASQKDRKSLSETTTDAYRYLIGPSQQSCLKKFIENTLEWTGSLHMDFHKLTAKLNGKIGLLHGERERFLCLLSKRGRVDKKETKKIRSVCLLINTYFLFSIYNEILFVRTFLIVLVVLFLLERYDATILFVRTFFKCSILTFSIFL